MICAQKEKLLLDYEKFKMSQLEIWTKKGSLNYLWREIRKWHKEYLSQQNFPLEELRNRKS